MQVVLFHAVTHAPSKVPILGDRPGWKFPSQKRTALARMIDS
jgi:hypothetical protein